MSVQKLLNKSAGRGGNRRLVSQTLPDLKVGPKAENIRKRMAYAIDTTPSAAANARTHRECEPTVVSVFTPTAVPDLQQNPAPKHRLLTLGKIRWRVRQMRRPKSLSMVPVSIVGAADRITSRITPGARVDPFERRFLGTNPGA